ncbi:hypothetical protein BKA93DRAFT_794010 [Sparassis latifolia]
MEVLCDDPVLAQELVRLLSNELKFSRQQLRELKAKDNRTRPSSEQSVAEQRLLRRQNEQLKCDVLDMRLRLEAALETQDENSHLSNPSPYDEVCAQLSETLEDRAQADVDHAEFIQHLEEKIITAREKYQRITELNNQNQQSLNNMREMLDEAAANRQAALERAVAAEAQRAFTFTKPAFNAVEFLNMSQADIPKPSIKAMRRLSSGKHLYLRNELIDLCVPGGFVKFSHNELLWSKDGFGHCLAFVPTHHFVYGSDTDSGTWLRSTWCAKMIEPASQKRDLFYMTGQVWYYYGTFECVGSAEVSASDVRKLGAKYMGSIEKRTIFSPELVPPFIIKMMQDMYTEGILSVACFGYRYVGFNHPLNQALQAQARVGKVDSVLTDSTGAISAKRSIDGEGGHYCKKQRRNTDA